MDKTEKAKKMKMTEQGKLRVLFLIIELCIYIGFMYIDLTNQLSYGVSSFLKFAGIILCWIYVMTGRQEYVSIEDEKKIICHEDSTERVKPWNLNNWDSTILRTALFFTVISDIFLLLTNYYTFGLITFCIVQFLYLARVSPEGKLKGKILRNIITAAFILIVVFIMGLTVNWLFVLTIIYFTGISYNVVDAVHNAVHFKKQNLILFAAGMILFILCDINVGLFNLMNFSVINAVWVRKVYEFASIAMWMFYLPAQVLIALSGDDQGLSRSFM